MPRGTQSTNPPQKPSALAIAALLILMIGFFAIMFQCDRKKHSAPPATPAPEATPNTAPAEVPGAPGSYYFPTTGHEWIVARYQFEMAHPEFRCEYSGARQRWAFEAAPTIVHYLVCRDTAVNAQDVTTP